MIEQVSVMGLALLPGGLCGFLLGLFYFRQLRRAVDSFSEQGINLMLVAGTLMRVGVAVAAFVVMMQWSALAAVCGLVGFSIARSRSVISGGLT